MKKRHPRGLYLLFATELWERFSYYSMRTLLVLYLTLGLGQSKEEALSILAIYSGLVYLTPLIGGFLADRYLGQANAIVTGGILMFLGHVLMSFPTLFFWATAFLIAGNGFFKPSISILVGRLYPPDDPRRDSAFSIFYMGINLGAFLAPIVSGYLGEVFGWHYGFAAAAIGMLMGLIIFLGFHRRYLAHFPLAPLKIVLFIALAFVVIAAVKLLLLLWDWQPLLCGLLLLLGLGWLLYRHVTLPTLTSTEKNRFKTLLGFAPFVIIFWLAFEQMGGILILFIRERVDHHWFGLEIPTTAFLATNPLVIIIFAPILAWLWQKKPFCWLSPLAKAALGLLWLALGFVMIFLARLFAENGLVSPWWVFLAYFLITIGELCLSPTSLALVAQLAPQRFASLSMGGFFLLTAMGSFAANQMAAFFVKRELLLYGVLATLAFLAGLLLFGLSRKLYGFSQGDKRKEEVPLIPL
jgi:POT family proton-dependent oligopeptide transporter